MENCPQRHLLSLKFSVVNISARMEEIDILLFSRPDGKPMVFCLPLDPQSEEFRLELVRKVKERGGLLLDHLTENQTGHVIHLLGQNEAPDKRKEMFDFRYLEDCIEKNQILRNLLEYRVSKSSIYQQYEPLDVLLGYKTWSDIPRNKKESVSDSDDDFQTTSEGADSEDWNERVFKPSRTSSTVSGSTEVLRDNSQMVRRMLEMEISSSVPFLPQSPEMLEGFLSPDDTQISPSGPTVIVWGSEESSSSLTSTSNGESSSWLSSDGEVAWDDAGYEADISANGIYYDL